VIKIEDPSTGGDVSRSIPPYAVEGDSLFFQSLNRNTKSITLNLRHPEGYATFRELARVSHAVFNNLRGDLPGCLGLTYAALRDANPSLVCCSLSGFGSTGPRASDPGYDYIVQAEAGYMALTGEPDGPPTRSGVSIVDFSTGYSAAMALLMGLVHAGRTGEGIELQVSLLDTARSMLNYLAAWHLNEGYEPERLPDSSHPSLVPSQVFPTSDGHIMVMCNKEKFWLALCDVLDAPELHSDPRFGGFAARLEHRDELTSLLKWRFRARTTRAWLAVLDGQVPASPVNDVSTAFAQAAREPGSVISVPHPVFGEVRQLSCPVKLVDEEPEYRAAPALGEHTSSVLQDLLAYTPERIEALRGCGAL
jgi:crotonobetainyl-CoA:carnitine CoA-transferase CaiB-like acyl-CoA transferase